MTHCKLLLPVITFWTFYFITLLDVSIRIVCLQMEHWAKPYRNSPFNTTLPEQCIECLDSSSEYFFCSLGCLLRSCWSWCVSVRSIWSYCSCNICFCSCWSWCAEVSGVTVVVIFVSAPGLSVSVFFLCPFSSCQNNCLLDFLTELHLFFWLAMMLAY